MAARELNPGQFAAMRTKEENRVGMSDVWMGAARMLASRSKCKRLQVGCIVTDYYMRRVLANGYNGRAANVDECPGTNPCCLHAEVNALVASGSLEKNKRMYVTVAPCEKCAMMIINSGFYEVVYAEEHENKAGVEMLEKGKVKTMRYRRRAERGANEGEKVFGDILEEHTGEVPA